MFDFSYHKTPQKLPDWPHVSQHVGNGIAADLDNDGIMDLITSTDITSSYLPNVSPIFIYRGDAWGHGYSHIRPKIDGQESYPMIHFGRDIWTGDINGDGLADFIPLDANEGRGLSTSGIFKGAPQFAYVSKAPFEYVQLSLADIDIAAHGFGSIQSTDGKFRFLINNPWTDQRADGTATVISTYRTDTAKFSTQYLSRLSDYHAQDGARFSEYFYATTIDVNNDGNTDTIGFSSPTGHNAIYLNDGQGSFHFHQSFSSGLPPGVVIEEATTGDFNGDGLPDLAVLAVDRRAGTDTHKYLRILLNDNGLNFRDVSLEWLDNAFNGVVSSFGYLDTYDFNRDGLDDIVFNHWKFDFDQVAGRQYTFFFEVFASTGSAFENFTIVNEVAPRTIPISATSFVDGLNQFTVMLSGKGNPASSDFSHQAFLPFNLSSSSIVVRESDVSILNKNREFLVGRDHERLVFKDQKVALDLQKHAGTVAKILGAVFGSDSVSNQELVGIGLDLLDRGMNNIDLAALAMVGAGKKTSRDVCDLLWRNVVGTQAIDSDLLPYRDQLDSGRLSVGQLASWAADTELNKINIDLVGLAQTGLHYV